MRNGRKILSILFLAAACLLFVFGNLLSQESAAEVFEKAFYYEDVQGDLQKAIELYEQILKQFPENREIAAKAQLHIGLCYEKLGLQEAPKAYQKVLDDFPEQKEAVKLAQEKLSVLRKVQSVIAKTEKEFNIRKAWAGPWADTTGAPSPDGRYLSFVDWMTGDLAIRDLATGKNRHLTDKGSWAESGEFALFSKWSPDGKKIVYNWLNKEEFFELRIVALDSPKPQILYSVKEKEYAHPFGWSPDGNNILALVTQVPNISQIGLISVADGSFRVLKISNDDWANSLPLFTFSPDGKYIAYSFLQDESTQNRDIFLMSVDDKNETQLISHPMNDSLLGWSPDGKWILFTSNRTGTQDAWIIRVDETGPKGLPEIVKKNMGFIDPLGFVQNGAFYYGVDNQMTDIYSIQIDADTGKILSPPKKATQHYEGSNRSPAYSADGKFLAYFSRRGPGPLSRNVLCIRDLQSGKEKEFNPEPKNCNYPRWSPDGRFISFEGIDKATLRGIYRIDVHSGVVDLIVQAEHGIVIYSHRWSKDGKSLFYTQSDDPKTTGQIAFRESHIYVHDIASGQDKILPGSPDDAKDIDISPDGQWLVFANRGAKKVLSVISTSGGEPRIFCSYDHPGIRPIYPTWIAGGRYIVFAKVTSGEDEAVETWEIVRVPIEGGEPQKLGLEMTEFRHLSVHPDGEQIVFHSRGSTMRWPEVWIIENFLPKK